jgi:hypothetical protein
MDDKTVLDKTPVDQIGPPRADDGLREQAVTELRKRRELAGHLMAFILVNTFVVIIWYVTGAGFFWPVFPIFAWGIGVVFHTWDVLWPQPTEASIRSTMDRIARRR